MATLGFSLGFRRWKNSEKIWKATQTTSHDACANNEEENWIIFRSQFEHKEVEETNAKQCQHSAAGLATRRQLKLATSRMRIASNSEERWTTQESSPVGNQVSVRTTRTNRIVANDRKKDGKTISTNSSPNGQKQKSQKEMT